MRHGTLMALVLGLSLSAAPARAATPDGLLTAQAKIALWTTDGVRSTSVHVDTNDGVVTLYGKVPTAEQRAIAEKTARAVGGVRSVKNLLQVVPESQEKRVSLSDEHVREVAEKHLKADLGLRDSKISIKSVDKGVVLLTGEAHTLSDQLRAIIVVDRIPGVRGVATEVKGPDGLSDDERLTSLQLPVGKPITDSKGAEAVSTASDMRISATVKLRLFSASHVPSTDISVDTEDGVVTLFGIVPTAAVRNAAVTETGKVSGVRRIQNQLEVVASSRQKAVEAKDDDITRDLSLAFKDRPEFSRVDLSVRNGTVRLTGSVSTGWDEVSAVRLARQVVGVRGVEDQLKVDGEPSAQTTQR